MRLLPLLAFLFLSLFALPASAAETWLLSVDRWGNPEYQILTLEEGRGGTLSGRLGDWPVTGQRSGDRVSFTGTDRFGDAHRFEGRVRDGRLSGQADYPDPNVRGSRAAHRFAGERLPERRAGASSPRVFEPTSFSNEFTAHRPPALVIWPGEVIATSTLDSGGIDKDGRTRALYGNPQTGPFFVFGADRGDVIAVRIRRLRLNRDWADSLDGFSARAMPPSLAAKAAELGKRVRWRLDRATGLARLENPPEALRGYAIPVRPMLGGIGVAPDFGFAPFSAGDTGRFGGNLDYNGVVEGVTVYLPVFQPGAMLFLGDGHALQGDGETTQWALETSLDVEFSVAILPARALATPRVESDTHITAIGQAGSLDEAVRSATAGMVQWLAQDYGLTPSEASLILGSAAEYRVVTLAGRNAGVALSLPTARLQTLKRRE